MSVTKMQVGVAGALMVAGVSGYLVQAESINDTRAEIAALQKQSSVVVQLRADNDQRARLAAEVADLRLDDALLAQLSDEAVALQAQWRKIAAAERARDAKPPAPLTGPIVDSSMLDRPPQAKVQARPTYPVDMIRAGVNGEVQVSFVTDTDGAVRNVKAEKSSRSEFEAAAIEALEKWKFSPGMKGGNKVNVRLSVPIIFKINDGKPGPLPAWWF
jgi:TonB family protein